MDGAFPRAPLSCTPPELTTHSHGHKQKGVHLHSVRIALAVQSNRSAFIAQKRAHRCWFNRGRDWAMAGESTKVIASRLTLAHLESTETNTVEKWLHFVADAFRGETVSSSTVCQYDDYDLKVLSDDREVEDGDIFHQRWHRDPASSPNVAFLALIDSDQIVASLRYFARCMYVKGIPVSCGCIGDVVTQAEFRGQGIATRLLTWCISEMKRDHIALSYLHTGPQAPLYQRLGWFEVPMTRTYMKMLFSNLDATWASAKPTIETQGFRIGRLRLDLVSESVIEEMAATYRDFCVRHRVTGSIVRSNLQYWRKYVDFECRRAQSSGILAAFDAQDKVVAWAVLKVKARRHDDGVLQVRVIELITCDDVVPQETLWKMFGWMILHALHTSPTSDVRDLDVTSSSQIPFELLLQDDLLSKALKLPLNQAVPIGTFSLCASAIEREAEEPIMYRIVTPSEFNFETEEEAQVELLRAGGDCHIFQKGDAF